MIYFQAFMSDIGIEIAFIFFINKIFIFLIDKIFQMEFSWTTEMDHLHTKRLAQNKDSED